jgi:membrane protease YdiL (CAAX protease family)
MLSAKPWKAAPIARLLLSVFVCIYAGSVVASALHFIGEGGQASLKFLGVLGGMLGFLGATLLLVRKPWQTEDVMRRLVVLLVCFYGGLALGAWAQKLAGPAAAEPAVSQMVVAALSFQGAALFLVARCLREHHMRWTEAFGFGNDWARALLFGLLVACLFMPLGWGLQLASAQLMEHLPYLPIKPEEQQAVQTLLKVEHWRDRLVLGGVTILLVPPAEEMLFRGILYGWIKQAGFPRLALWGTALLFAAVHVNLVSFIPLAVLALVLTALYERTDNLLAPITAHALFNALNFTLLYLLENERIRTH